MRASGVGHCSSAALSAEANGGTLVLNAAYLKRGFDFARVEFEGKTFEASGDFGDDRGQTFPIAGVYDALALNPKRGTEIVAKDAKGRPLITRAKFGKGKVVVVAPLWMAPKFEHDPAWVIDQTRNAKRTFSFTAYMLERLQHVIFSLFIFTRKL
ncbi:MAG: hypothetical protein PHV28_07855 [Kiritimatiellae bacterium]|nr:hypothetical protein [Kiritimatiellia bacterium]